MERQAKAERQHRKPLFRHNVRKAQRDKYPCQAHEQPVRAARAGHKQRHRRNGQRDQHGRKAPDDRSRVTAQYGIAQQVRRARQIHTGQRVRAEQPSHGHAQRLGEVRHQLLHRGERARRNRPLSFVRAVPCKGVRDGRVVRGQFFTADAVDIRPGEIPHQQIHIVWELLFFIEQELSAAHGISPQEMHRLVRSLHGRVGKHETEPGQKNQHSGFQSQVLFEEMRGQKHQKIHGGKAAADDECRRCSKAGHARAQRVRHTPVIYQPHAAQQHKEISAKPADAGLCPKPFAFFCKFRHKYSIRRPHVVSCRRQICNILSIYYKLYASTL